MSAALQRGVECGDERRPGSAAYHAVYRQAGGGLEQTYGTGGVLAVISVHCQQRTAAYAVQIALHKADVIAGGAYALW